MGLLPLDYSDPTHDDSISRTVVNSRHGREGAAFYNLIQLMFSLINASASQTSLQGPISASLDEHEPRDTYWTQLRYRFDRWHSALPPSFQADTVLSHEDGVSDHRLSIFAEEAWFSNSPCAVAMAYYHMAKSLLLIMQPQSLDLIGGSLDQGRHFDLLRAYRVLQDELRYHAKQIISIALGMVDDASRMHMVQPLYVSGRCLTEMSERRRLAGMLRNINQELGVSTEYRIRDLCDEWRIPISEVLG